MDFRGEKFLDSLYKDLINSIEVKNSNKRFNINDSDKYKSIKAYLYRLNNVHNMASNKHKKEILLSFYYAKYVIKEGNINSGNKDVIIDSQKKSLKLWLDILCNNNFPMWAKYWAFQGMIRMGSYNERTGKFNRRTDKTVAPFPPANLEVITNSIESMKNILDNNLASIDNYELRDILEGGNFSKIYTYFYKRMKNKIEKGNIYDGVWTKYNEESIDEAKRLFDDLQGKMSGWCTANYTYAVNQICGGGGYPGGDFYIYYTKDKENNYTIPRIAIRMDGTKKIGEIRGTQDGENIEDGLEEIVDDKLKSFSFLIESDRKKYMDIISDQRMLTKINKKTYENKTLNKDEVLFLYEVNRNIKSFGEYEVEDPRIDRIKDERDKKGLSYKDFYDTDTLLDVISKKSYIFKYARDDLKDNQDFITKLMKENINIFRYASDRLKDKKDFVLSVVSRSGYMLSYVSERLRDDKEVVLGAVKNYSGSIEYASERLKEDSDILINAFKGDYLDLIDADVKVPDYLLNDNNFIIKAVREGAVDILNYKKLNDKDLIMKLISVCPQNKLYKLRKCIDNYDISIEKEFNKKIAF